MIPAIVAIVAFAAHVATSWRYGYFRDELYFIACSKHLAWGYVDQPPLVALAARLSAPADYNLIALRVLPAASAALTVWLAARIAREFGGGRFAQGAAAICVALVPAYLLLGNTLTTTSFEPLSWTLFVYALIRMIQTNRTRYWMAASAAFIFGMYGKYSMLALAACTLFALLCTPQRRLLRSCWLGAGIAVSAAALAPNLFWQAAHAWPFLEVVRGDFQGRHAFQTGVALEYTGLLQNAGAFILEQVLYGSPFFVPIWVAGALLPAAVPQLRAYRFIPIAFAALLVLAVALAAKGYYIIGIYASLLAAGSVAVERIAAAPVRLAAFTAAVALTAFFIPMSLPVLPINTFIAYTKLLRLTGQGGAPGRLIQPLYAEEFGWDELARHVAAVYDALPPAQRAGTAVFADTYGDAGALDYYGPRYGLPPAISAQNTYYLWGFRAYDGRSVIVVGATQAERIRTLYRSMRLIATYGNPYKWIVEGPTPIYLCSDPVAPMAQLWKELRWYGA